MRKIIKGILYDTSTATVKCTLYDGNKNEVSAIFMNEIGRYFKLENNEITPLSSEEVDAWSKRKV